MPLVPVSLRLKRDRIFFQPTAASARIRDWNGIIGLFDHVTFLLVNRPGLGQTAAPKRTIRQGFTVAEGRSGPFLGLRGPRSVTKRLPDMPL